MEKPTTSELELNEERHQQSSSDIPGQKEDKADMPKKIRFPYSMAIERNARRLRTQIRTGEFIPGKEKPGYIRRVPTKKEVKKKNIEALLLARHISDLAVRIQEALDSEEGPNEALALSLLITFYNLPTTPLCLQYSPTMLLTLKKCKNYQKNIEIQLVAKKAYDRCKAMFPFFWDTGFEAAYIEKVKLMAASELKDFDMTDIIQELQESMFGEDPIDDVDD